MRSYEPWELAALDIDWFAVDRKGHIGHFTTGGGGVAPPTPATRRRDVNERTLSYLLGLPVVTEAISWAPALKYKTLLGDANNYFAPYVALARRGVFSFDIQIKHDEDGSGTYMCVAAPTDDCIEISRLPYLAPLLERAVFKEWEFGLGIVLRSSAA